MHGEWTRRGSNPHAAFTAAAFKAAASANSATGPEWKLPDSEFGREIEWRRRVELEPFAGVWRPETKL